MCICGNSVGVALLTSIFFFFGVQEHSLIRVSGWSRTIAVDVDFPLADAKRFTNCGNEQDCCKFIELCIANDCMFIMGAYDSYRSRKDPALSMYYGVPILDVKGLLSNITKVETAVFSEDRNYIEFASGLPVASKFAVSVKTIDKIANPEYEDSPRCTDLALVPPGMGVCNAYFIRFLDSADAVMFGVFVCMRSGARVIKKRWCIGQTKEESYDPFSTEVHDPPNETGPVEDVQEEDVKKVVKKVKSCKDGTVKVNKTPK